MEVLVLSIACILLALVGVVSVNYLKSEISKLKLELIEKDILHEAEKKKVHQNSKFRSAAANWGFTIENFVPFIDTFPIPPEDVNFLGKPIDYVGFTDTESKTKCKVHFIEVKSGSAFLSQKQKNIKKAIEEGRVEWHEVRVDANKPE